MHKTANVPNKLPKSVQARAKSMPHDIWMADGRRNADPAFDLFVETFRGEYESAVKRLEKARDPPLALYDFPAEQLEGCGSHIACLTMLFKLALSAKDKWRARNGAKLLADVIDGCRV